MKTKMTTLILLLFSAVCHLTAQRIGTSPTGGPIILTDDGDDTIIVAGPGDWDKDDWTVISCKHYPKICDDMKPKEDKPDEKTPDEPGKGKKKKKKKKDQPQAYSYHELPATYRTIVDEFRLKGFKAARIRPDGTWFEIDHVEEFIAKRLTYEP